jgi:hypothetical protein
MTAVNVVTLRDVVVLFTDTKATRDNGVQYNVTKYALFPWMRMAIAVRGHVGALHVFERNVSANANTYERAVQYLVEHFDELLAGEYEDFSEAHAMKQDLDVYLVGWGLTGPQAHWISNYRTTGQIQRIDGCHISPMVDREALVRFAPDVKGGMPALMADQARQNPGVGGWIMVTEIYEDHIMSYPLGGICPLSSVASREQPQEEIDAWKEIARLNADRAARQADIASGA